MTCHAVGVLETAHQDRRAILKPYKWMLPIAMGDWLLQGQSRTMSRILTFQLEKAMVFHFLKICGARQEKMNPIAKGRVTAVFQFSGQQVQTHS